MIKTYANVTNITSVPFGLSNIVNHIAMAYNKKLTRINATFLHVLTINKWSTIMRTLCTQGIICSSRFHQQHFHSSDFNLLHPNGQNDSSSAMLVQ